MSEFPNAPPIQFQSVMDTAIFVPFVLQLRDSRSANQGRIPDACVQINADWSLSVSDWTDVEAWRDWHQGHAAAGRPFHDESIYLTLICAARGHIAETPMAYLQASPPTIEAA